MYQPTVLKGVYEVRCAHLSQQCEGIRILNRRSEKAKNDVDRVPNMGRKQVFEEDEVRLRFEVTYPGPIIDWRSWWLIWVLGRNSLERVKQLQRPQNLQNILLAAANTNRTNQGKKET